MEDIERLQVPQQWGSLMPEANRIIRQLAEDTYNQILEAKRDSDKIRKILEGFYQRWQKLQSNPTMRDAGINEREIRDYIWAFIEAMIITSRSELHPDEEWEDIRLGLYREKGADHEKLIDEICELGVGSRDEAERRINLVKGTLAWALQRESASLVIENFGTFVLRRRIRHQGRNTWTAQLTETRPGLNIEFTADQNLQDSLSIANLTPRAQAGPPSPEDYKLDPYHNNSLGKAICRLHSLEYPKARQVFLSVLAGIVETLSQHMMVHIDGFGTFACVQDQTYTSRNPKTGGTIRIPTKPELVFQASPTFRRRLSNQAQSWEGAKIMEHQTDYLDLSNGYWSTVSEEEEVISKLTNLLRLNLSYNYLKELPTSIEKLENLEWLDLRWNEFGPQLERLARFNSRHKLKELYLNFNQIYAIPPIFFDFPNLELLDLGGNFLSTFPEEIGLLENLQKLYLNSNLIDHLPVEIGLLSKLTQLGLYKNNLTELPPEIGSLVNLKELYLGHNQLTNLPLEIGNLANLEKLVLSHNQFNFISAGIGDFVSLVQLDLDGNEIVEIPPEIGRLYSLQRLDLSDNSIVLVSSQIGDLLSLRYLDLSYNRISELGDGFYRLTKLKTLDLTGNPVSDFEVESLVKSLPDTEILY